MTGKLQGSYARGRAAAADLVGWAQFLKKDYAAAAAKLGEAERLSQGLDFVNEFHLGELARAQKASARARDHYLDALSLAGGPTPLRQKAKDALAALQAGERTAAGFDAWLETELARRRDDRKAAALKSLVDRPLPKLALTTVDGKPFDAASLRGKVVLLDFFASWCGICRAELPQLKARVREVSERSERRVPAGQHRRGRQTAAAVPGRDEVSVPGRAADRGAGGAGDGVRQRAGDVLRRRRRRRPLSAQRIGIARRLGGPRGLVHRSGERTPVIAVGSVRSTAYLRV